MFVDRSTNAPAGLTLGAYIAALIDALGDANPAALARMRQVVGERQARIGLDDEAVDIWFSADRLNILAADAATEVDGLGTTNSATVLAMLDGYLEMADAILDGRLHVAGAPEQIIRMFLAIEILLDTSPRTPGLQTLADRFRRERRERRDRSLSAARRSSWYPFTSDASEHDLLARLNLLPEDSSGRTR